MSESSSYGNWVRLSVQPPFHLEATVRVLQRRPINPIDIWNGEIAAQIAETRLEAIERCIRLRKIQPGEVCRILEPPQRKAFGESCSVRWCSSLTSVEQS